MAKEEFDHAIKEWIEHCGTLQVGQSSSLNLTNCDACRKIISMGYEALPLIRRLYDEDSSNNFALRIIQGRGLSAIVRKIVKGELSIDDYTRKWLDDNMHHYLPANRVCRG